MSDDDQPLYDIDVSKLGDEALKDVGKRLEKASNTIEELHSPVITETVKNVREQMQYQVIMTLAQQTLGREQYLEMHDYFLNNIIEQTKGENKMLIGIGAIGAELADKILEAIETHRAPRHEGET